MRYCVIILLFILANAENVIAQMPQFRLSQKSILKIESAESAEKKLKLSRRLFHRDSVRFKRDVRRYYRHFSDSLFNAGNEMKNRFYWIIENIPDLEILNFRVNVDFLMK